jgi:NAD(P)-dependent dehydrogenase (short-subunit alcohol dehydrogenase family)
MADLRGRVVVATGASSGIGRAAALGFSRKGARLVLVSRNDEALDNVAKECVGSGGEALTFPADMADYSAVEEIRDFAVSHFGGIDVWVNCAAVLIFGRFEEVPPPLFHRLVDTNVFGYINGSQVALKQFRSQADRGVLINVSSMLGVAPEPHVSVYVASKFFIRGLTVHPAGVAHHARHSCVCYPSCSHRHPYVPESGECVRPQGAIHYPRLLRRAGRLCNCRRSEPSSTRDQGWRLRIRSQTHKLGIVLM